jgi:hypothetical protein
MKKYKGPKYDYILIGRYKPGPDQCGGCAKVEKLVPTRPATRRYRHIDIDSKLGKKVADKLKIKEMPYIIKCPVDKTQKCTKIVGYRGIGDYE